MYDNVTIPCPEGYKWVCAARKKDIEWQAMRDWRILGARKHFQSLEKLFLTGERDKDIYGMVTEEGIVNCGRLIYEKEKRKNTSLLTISSMNSNAIPSVFTHFFQTAVGIPNTTFPIQITMIHGMTHRVTILIPYRMILCLSVWIYTRKGGKSCKRM